METIFGMQKEKNVINVRKYKKLNVNPYAIASEMSTFHVWFDFFSVVKMVEFHKTF